MHQQLIELSNIDMVNLFEQQMNKVPLASENNGIGRAELQVEHFFSPGVYARCLFIPKDTLLTGKIHKYENLNILAKGAMAVLIDGEICKVCAPFVVVSPPGTKRIAHTYEDCVWITIHGTELTDINEIENKFIAQSEQEFLEFCGQERLKLDCKD